MIRVIFLLYWLWHSIWLYGFFFNPPLNQEDAKAFTLSGAIQLGLISLLPSIIFIWREKTYHNDYKFWKLCMLSALFRTIFSISAFAGYKYYFSGFLLTIFAMVVLILIDKSFKKNSDSINYI